MIYGNIIDQFKFTRSKVAESLRSLFLALKRAGMAQSELDEKFIKLILEKLVSETVNKKYSRELDYFLLKLIKQCAPMLDNEIQEKPSKDPEQIEEGSEDWDYISKLKPEDFKNKELDLEFLELLGCENPDE